MALGVILKYRIAVNHLIASTLLSVGVAGLWTITFLANTIFE